MHVTNQDVCMSVCQQHILALPQQLQGLSTSGIDGSTVVDVARVPRLPSLTTGVQTATDGHSRWRWGLQIDQL